MKQFIFILIIGLIAMTSFAQVSNPDSIPEVKPKVAVLDSTIINDMKLLIVADRFYAKNGLIETLVNQASKEKAETGKIEKSSAIQTFIDNINADYDKLLKKFIQVDTVWVNKKDVDSQISSITEWQQSVLLDPEIKNATSLTVWENKDKELKKLLRYKEQIPKQN